MWNIPHFFGPGCSVESYLGSPWGACFLQDTLLCPSECSGTYCIKATPWLGSCECGSSSSGYDHVLVFRWATLSHLNSSNRGKGMGRMEKEHQEGISWNLQTDDGTWTKEKCPCPISGQPWFNSGTIYDPWFPPGVSPEYSWCGSRTK